MDGIAASLIVKIIAMMIFVIALFVFALFFFKRQLFAGGSHQYFKIINTVFINNKDRLVEFNYKENSYLIYINPNNSILLDKQEGQSINIEEPLEEKNLFKSIIDKVYKQ